MPSLRRLLRLVLAAGLSGYVAIGVWVVLHERSMVFPGAGPGKMPALARGSRLLRIPAAEHETLALFTPPQKGQRVVVHFHGNGEQLSDLTTLSDRFSARGLGFLAVEYPGYGLAPGRPTEESVDDAGQTALDYLRSTLRISRDRIVIEGYSIGTGVATEMARRGLGARLILTSPYTSIADLGPEMLPWYPRRLVVRDVFDSEDKAPGISAPTLILHGTADHTIPFRMGTRLAALFPNVAFEPVEGAGHLLTLRESVLRRVVEFASQP